MPNPRTPISAAGAPLHGAGHQRIEAQPRRVPVGFVESHYNETRNFLSLPLSRYEFRRVPNLVEYARKIYWTGLWRIRRPRLMAWYYYLHADWHHRGVRLLHFFDTVSLGRTPWIATFQNHMPRWNPRSRVGLALLGRPQCKRLIAFSRSTASAETHLLEKNLGARAAEKILRKLTVLHPAQAPLIARYEDKPLSDVIVFTLVGSHFFRKGGFELLRAVERLIHEGRAVRLNIVSDLGFGDWASQTTAEDKKAAEAIINRFPNAIRHYPKLANSEVLDLLRGSHVGLLPTWADEYGYSVLEAQAAGCPVISSDIRSLPEINNDSTGWLIEVPKSDGVGNARIRTREDRAALSELLTARLYDIMSSIARSPEVIAQKGIRALDRIRTEHDPRATAARLEAIYDEALFTDRASL